MDEDEANDIRKMEIEFEEKYKEVYALREKVINGKSGLDEVLIEEFNEVAKKMKDDAYDKLEVEPCDVKAI